MKQKDETIAEKLAGRDPDDKIVGLYTLLHEAGKAFYISELAQCMNSKRQDVRLGAIMVLSKTKSDRVIPILRKALADSSLQIRIHAAFGLARMRDEAAVPMLRWIIEKDYEDHSVHKRAIEALGLFKKKEFLPLFELAVRHRRKLSRIKAVHAISRIKTKKSLSILRKALSEEEDPSIRSRITQKLREMQDMV